MRKPGERERTAGEFALMGSYASIGIAVVAVVIWFEVWLALVAVAAYVAVFTILYGIGLKIYDWRSK